MGNSRSVQFRSPAAVLQAYLNRNAGAWSIWQGSQFMFKCETADVAEGAQELEDVLKVLHQSGAIYTLKIYEDLGKAAKIKSNTPDDGSFNFRFAGEDVFGMPGQGSAAMNELVTEIKSLRLKVEQLEADEDDNEPNRLGMLGDILEVPGISEALVQVIPGVVSRLMGNNPAAPQALAGVQPAGFTTLDQAITFLKQSDADFEDHMIQLATLARDKPVQFKSIIGMMKYI
jgi:hypothetical protein